MSPDAVVGVIKNTATVCIKKSLNRRALGENKRVLRQFDMELLYGVGRDVRPCAGPIRPRLGRD